MAKFWDWTKNPESWKKFQNKSGNGEYYIFAYFSFDLFVQNILFYIKEKDFSIFLDLTKTTLQPEVWDNRDKVLTMRFNIIRI